MYNDYSMKFFEHHKRSLAKTFTYRMAIIVSHVAVVYAMTGNWDVAVGTTAFTSITSTIIYFGHERVWNKIHWGKEKHTKKVQFESGKLLAFGVGLGVLVGLASGFCVPVAVGLGLGVAVGDAVAVGVADGTGVATGDPDGVGEPVDVGMVVAAAATVGVGEGVALLLLPLASKNKPKSKANAMPTANMMS